MIHCLIQASTVSPRVNSLGAYLFFGCLHGGLFEGGEALKVSLVAGDIPVEIFLLVSCFLDATHSSSMISFKGQANVR